MNTKINILKIKAGGWILMILIILLSFSSLYSQKPVEKKVPLIDIKYFNFNHDSFLVHLSSVYKDEKVFPVEYQTIKLYFNEVSDVNFLGKATTDINGRAKVILPERFKLLIDTCSTFDLLAESAENANYESGSGSVTISNAYLELKTYMEDTVKMMRVTAFTRGINGKIPLSEVEVNFYVNKMVGLYPLSEESLITDSAGMAEMEYSISDLPGDADGILIIATKLTDEDTYGNLISTSKEAWGVKSKYDNNFSSIRALWATANRVPIWLLFLASSIIIVVWGSLLYIVLQVNRIYRIGKKQIA